MIQKDGSKTPLILPNGTQVVTRVEVKSGDGRVLCSPGAVGTIVGTPTDPRHAYRIRFPDEREVSLGREALSIRKREHERALLERTPLDERDLTRYVIYRCLTGSRAYGLARDDSDEDRRGIYLPPAELQWSLFGVPEQLGKQGER